VLYFIKVMGWISVAGGLTIWWVMLTGILAGKIDATTKGGELWFTRVDSPTAFWVTVLVYFLVGLLFFWGGYSVLRKDNLPPPSE
jgi:hypothetical protein